MTQSITRPSWILTISLCLWQVCFAQTSTASQPNPIPTPVKTITKVEQFAVALIEAKTEDDRKALLAEHKELQTAELQVALMRQGRRFGEQVEQVVSSNGALGYVPRDYQRALISYSLAQVIAEQRSDRAGIADAIQGIGEAHYGQGKHDLALEAHQKALTLYETLGKKPGIAHALYGISNVHQALGRDDLVKEYCEKVVALTDALQGRAADQLILGGALGDLGGIYHVGGKYSLALDYYQKSLPFYEAAESQRYVGLTLWLIGNAQQALNDFDASFENHKKSLRILETSGNRMWVPNVMQALASGYLFRGDFGRALEYRQKVLALFEARADNRRIPMALISVGVVHYMQGSYELAMEYYEKALRQVLVNNKAARSKGEAAANEASVLERIGRTHAMLGNYDQALETSRKAIDLNKASGSEWSKGANAFISTDIAYVHLKRGEDDLALKYFQQALADETDGNPWTKTRGLNGIADIYLRRGKYTEALDLTTRSAAAFKEGLFRGNALYGLLDSRTLSGKAHHRLNQLTEARQAFEEAIELVEGLRTQVTGGEQERQRFFEGLLSPYHAMVDFLITQNNAGEALTYAERAKARVLLEVLQSGNVNVTKAMTEQERIDERKLVGEMVSLNTQISQERMQPQSNPKRLNELNERLKKARVDYETFQLKLYLAHPQLKAQRAKMQPLKIDEAVELLPDANSALLEYVVTDEKTYLFVITKRNGHVALKTHAIDIKSKDLIDRTKSFRQQLAKRNLMFRDSATALADLLLKPAHEELQGKTSLVIVPDGVLWELPFQALQSASHRYLIEDYAISYAPSLTVLREMRKLTRQSAASSSAPKLLALGNPALKTETVLRVKSVFRDEKLDPLPEAEREVKELKQLYGAAQSTVYIGADAREERLKSEASRFTVLHLATHGILNDASPMYSQVLLSQAGDDPNEDGLLEAWEVMKLDLRADLVVLSACDTARGRFGAGEGMIGLTWALFVAGTPITVVSQWKVESAGTTELMVEFHRQLQSQRQERLSTSSALREAALKLLHSNQYRHPFHWAGFVVVGDGR